MEKATRTTDTPATRSQRDHIRRFGVRKVPKGLTLQAASDWIDKLHQQETPEHRELRLSLMDYSESDPIGDQLRRWRITIWTVILLGILGIGWLIHPLFKAFGRMVR